MLKLNNLSSPKGANRKRKRIGRGEGSGQGTQAGKGHKGQKARSGGGTRIGFEGGQTPLYRRLPKRGFNNTAFATEVVSLSLKAVANKFEGDEVTRETLISKGLLNGRKKTFEIKILNDDTVSKAVNFKGIEKFSKTARENIIKNGGSIN
ncbi:50S ribosomal protein L15 [Bacteriovoracaceae bacterium]|nr:50S ribosomal protein L15 [Bacteriovoracaceae bacterium]